MSIMVDEYGHSIPCSVESQFIESKCVDVRLSLSWFCCWYRQEQVGRCQVASSRVVVVFIVVDSRIAISSHDDALKTKAVCI